MQYKPLLICYIHACTQSWRAHVHTCCLSLTYTCTVSLLHTHALSLFHAQMQCSFLTQSFTVSLTHAHALFPSYPCLYSLSLTHTCPACLSHTHALSLSYTHKQALEELPVYPIMYIHVFMYIYMSVSAYNLCATYFIHLLRSEIYFSTYQDLEDLNLEDEKDLHVYYGVATISRIDRILSFFCRIQSR